MKARRARSVETSRSCVTAPVSNAIPAARRADAANGTGYRTCIGAPLPNLKRMQTRFVDACGVLRSAIDASVIETQTTRAICPHHAILHSKSRLVVTGALVREVQK